MSDAVENIKELLKKKKEIDRDMTRAETNLENATAARKKVLAELKSKYGIEDPKDIDSKLDSIREQAEQLMQEIEDGLPDRYKSKAE